MHETSYNSPNAAIHGREFTLNNIFCSYVAANAEKSLSGAAIMNIRLWKYSDPHNIEKVKITAGSKYSLFHTYIYMLCAVVCVYMMCNIMIK